MNYAFVFCLGAIITLIVSPFLLGLGYYLLFAFGFLDLTGASTTPEWFAKIRRIFRRE